MASAKIEPGLNRPGLAVAAAALLGLAGCGSAEQPAKPAPGALQRDAEQEDARKASDKARRNSEADARSATRVKADMERFERSEREAGR